MCRHAIIVVVCFLECFCVLLVYAIHPLLTSSPLLSSLLLFYSFHFPSSPCGLDLPPDLPLKWATQIHCIGRVLLLALLVGI